MKLLSTFFSSGNKIDSLFDQKKGKSLAEYQRELLIKMGKRQIEKLNELGLTFPVSLG